MFMPCLVIISSICLRCSGGMAAIAFCASSICLASCGLVGEDILLVISHKPGLVLLCENAKLETKRPMAIRMMRMK